MPTPDVVEFRVILLGCGLMTVTIVQLEHGMQALRKSRAAGNRGEAGDQWNFVVAKTKMGLDAAIELNERHQTPGKHVVPLTQAQVFNCL